MKKAMLLCFVSASLAAIGSIYGCGGSEDDTTDGAAAGCFDYAGYDGTTPATTFKADVLPIFQNSCGLAATCHGDPSSPMVPAGEHRPYLGPNKATAATDADIQAIMDANVGVASVKGAGMQIIAPGKPDQSFLMHKMDGLCGSELTCEGVGKGQPCGETMPQLSSLLGIEQRDVVRRWIAQGAKND